MLDPTTPTVRFDGLYQSEKVEDGEAEAFYYEYLRFFPDGTVVDTPSSGEPHEVSKWLYKGLPSLSAGVFHCLGDKVTFSTSWTENTVDYECTITGDRLVASTYSHFDGYREIVSYRFVQVG